MKFDRHQNLHESILTYSFPELQSIFVFDKMVSYFVLGLIFCCTLQSSSALFNTLGGFMNALSSAAKGDFGKAINDFGEGVNKDVALTLGTGGNG